MSPPTLPELLAQSLRSACGGDGAPALSWPSPCARYAFRKTSATLGLGVLLHNTAKQMRSRTCNRLSHLLRCNARPSRPHRHLNVHESRGSHARDKEHPVYKQTKCGLLSADSPFVTVSLHKQPVRRRVVVAGTNPAHHFLSILMGLFSSLCTSVHHVMQSLQIDRLGMISCPLSVRLVFARGFTVEVLRVML